MFATTTSAFDQTYERAVAIVEQLRQVALREGGTDAMVATARLGDRLHLTGIELMARGGFANDTGVSLDTALRVDGRRTAAEARAWDAIAAMLDRFPRIAEAFRAGRLSVSEMRGLAYEVKRCRTDAQRAEVDALVVAVAGRCSDPEDMLGAVSDLIASQREDLVQARDDRAFDGRSLSIQADLEGGGVLVARGDVASLATVASAIDANAARPGAADCEIPRAQQRFDSLVNICQRSLSGIDEVSLVPAADATTQRTKTTVVRAARPTALVSIQLTGTDEGWMASGRLLWQLRGRSPRLSQVSTEMFMCTSDFIPVAYRGPHPIATGDKGSQPSEKVKWAVISRDGGCRFPGCDAPAQWCEAHHLEWGGISATENLALFCRRCHRRIHRYKWKIRMLADGAIEFRCRGKRYVSAPRGRSFAPL
jgi:hypothetical protein